MGYSLVAMPKITKKPESPKQRRVRRPTILRSLLEGNILTTARAWNVPRSQLSDGCQGKDICETTRRKIEAATGLDYAVLRLPVSDLIAVFFSAAKDAGVFDE